jgi:hypothetical protein
LSETRETREIERRGPSAQLLLMVFGNVNALMAVIAVGGPYLVGAVVPLALCAYLYRALAAQLRRGFLLLAGGNLLLGCLLGLTPHADNGGLRGEAIAVALSAICVNLWASRKLVRDANADAAADNGRQA